MRTWIPVTLVCLLAAIGCQVLAQNKVVMCYYTNWSQYRTNRKFFPGNIDPELCSHAVFSFAKLTGNRLAAFEWNDVLDYTKGLYEQFNDLKMRNPSLKTLLAVGGWTARAEGFSAMASTAGGRQEFASTSITWLRDNGFDGLDLDWEYPGATDRGGRAVDKANFVLLIQDLRAAFNAETRTAGQAPLLLTAAVGAGFSTVANGYDVPQLSIYLDYINVMTYDLHGAWDRRTGHNAALYTPDSDPDNFSLFPLVMNWIQQGAAPNKLLVGLALYGRTWTLADPSDTRVGAPTNGPGTKGQYSGEAGILTYYEVCDVAFNGGYTIGWDEQSKVPYAYKGDQWITFDNAESIKYKMQWILANGFAGSIVWAIDQDDFDGTICGQGRYPLMNVIKSCLIDGVSCNPSGGGAVQTTPTTQPPTTQPPTTQPPTTQPPRITTRQPYYTRPTYRPTTRTPYWPTYRPTTRAPVRTTTRSDDTDAQCPLKSGYFRDLNDCSVFWICWLPYRSRIQCPPGTWFDESYKVCGAKRDPNCK